ncbi:unnamed protein product [Sphagnum tenellum]
MELADPSDGMPSVAWELDLVHMANAPDMENFIQVLVSGNSWPCGLLGFRAQIFEHIVKSENVRSRNDASSEVLLARDTRPSGEALVPAACQGVEAVRGTVAHDMGILTTLQLHWMVQSFNNGVPAPESDYFQQHSNSFRCPSLSVLSITISTSILSCASINGDGDQVVYFYIPDKHEDRYSGPVCTLHLLDGDKIAAIFGLFIIGQLYILAGSKSSVSNATAAHKAVIPGNAEVKVAVVQTAYANGPSTNYTKQVLRLEVASTPTGVINIFIRRQNSMISGST